MIHNPPYGLSEILAFYGVQGSGNPGEDVQRYIKSYTFPVKMPVAGENRIYVARCQLHESLHGSLNMILMHIRAQFPASYRLLTFDGSYVQRNKRGAHEISMHDLGAAIDFNGDEFPMGDRKLELYDMPIWYQHVIETFISYKWKWGGDFPNGDGMHFQYGYGY